MKSRVHKILARTAPFAWIALGLLLTGCGNAAQEQAFAHALQLEESFTPENAPAIIAEYRRAIAVAPGSSRAQEAGAHVKALEARVLAAEQHRTVFQEHGVD
jgi:hypothetical protein